MLSPEFSTASLTDRPVDRRCEWVAVYARTPCGSRRFEGGMWFSWVKHLDASHSPAKANILINKDQRACIADFGLSTITGVTTRATSGGSESQASLISKDTLMSFAGGGTRRWMSPELLYPEKFGMPESEGNRPTRQSDCYALGMVIYEVGVHTTEFVAANS